MPAETVEIRQGILLVDGVSLEENYVPQEYREGIDFPPQATPQGHYFVLEESRNGPADSRTWGAVPGESIIGRVSWIYWLPERRQHIPKPSTPDRTFQSPKSLPARCGGRNRMESPGSWAARARRAASLRRVA